MIVWFLTVWEILSFVVPWLGDNGGKQNLMELHVSTPCPLDSLTYSWFFRIHRDGGIANDKETVYLFTNLFPCILESMPNHAYSYIKTITINKLLFFFVISANNFTRNVLWNLRMLDVGRKYLLHTGISWLALRLVYT